MVSTTTPLALLLGKSHVRNLYCALGKNPPDLPNVLRFSVHRPPTRHYLHKVWISPLRDLHLAAEEQSQRLSELAKDYTYAALLTLVDVAKNGRSDAARVSAANALLDRGYGKPAVKEEIEAINLPPVVIQVKAPDDNATE